MSSFIFRTDSSNQIGTGHLIRCLTLAKKLRESGNHCIFVCRDLKNNSIAQIKLNHFEVHILPRIGSNLRLEKSNNGKKLKHSNWLGVTQKTDFLEFKKFVKTIETPFNVVIDHYAIDKTWESMVRPLCQKIIVIDDLADRNHDCDFLIDQNLISNGCKRYHSIVPRKCKILLGPHYSILQRDYALLHNKIPPVSGKISKIFIYFGGADNTNLTGLTLNAILSLNLSRVLIEVVVDKSHPSIIEIKEIVSEHKNINIHTEVNSLANLMSRCDIAIGAAGSTSWERCCLGLYSIVITLADNQISIAQSLSEQGYAKYLGHKDRISLLDIKNALSDVIKLKDIESLSQYCMDLVDGKGCDRISHLIADNYIGDLRLRYANAKDHAKIRTWFQNTRSEENSVVSKIKTKINSHSWFKKSLRSSENYYHFVLNIHNLFDAGYVLLHKEKQNWIFNCFVDEQFELEIPKREIFLEALNILRSDTKNSISLLLGETFKATLTTIKNSILHIHFCSDSDSWINKYIPHLIYDLSRCDRKITWSHSHYEITNADLSFYLSYSRVIEKSYLDKSDNNLVVHESKLPEGKGWSPMSWQILEDVNTIAITLFEAAETVDSGKIYLQEFCYLSGGELHDEWRNLQGMHTINICNRFIGLYPGILKMGHSQKGKSTFYPKRTPADSLIDSSLSIAKIFNKLRICDNNKYPAYFYMNNKKYILKIYDAHE